VTAHIDILEAHESLRKPVLGSVALHCGVAAFLVVGSFVSGRPRDLWGNPNSLGGGSVGITPVSQIPLPSRGGPANPLADDTESAIPQPPPSKQAAKKAVAAQEASIAIKARGQTKVQRQYKSSQPRADLRTKAMPGQIYSDSGRALSSPLVGQTGSGGVGMGPGSAFGARFGAYRDQLEQMVARKWRTADVNPMLQTAPPAIVTFTLRRDGSATDVRLDQSSGDKALDYSAQRAIYEASPFPPLPAAYERNEARIEFWFQLKR
jgi:protein TonB